MNSAEDTQTKFYTSNVFIAGLVAVLTVLTASAAYLGSNAQIAGDDFDIEMQNSLILATTVYLEGNQIAMKDFAIYEGYLLNLEDDEEKANAYLNGASPELLANISASETPFNEAYFETRYAEAKRLYAEAESLGEKGDRADEQTLRFQLAMLIFAFGLAMTGWASLADTRPQIIRTFVAFALIALITGLLTLVFAVLN